MPAGLDLVFEGCLALGLFLFIGWILWLVGWLVLFNFSVEELREVIGEDDEGGLHLLGLVARGPGFELVKLQEAEIIRFLLACEFRARF